MATDHKTACKFCGRSAIRTTIQSNPPNLAALLAAVQCSGEGCDPDQGELPDDPDTFPMGEQEDE